MNPTQIANIVHQLPPISTPVYKLHRLKKNTREQTTKQLPKADQPQEKLLAHGAPSLTDSELLSIIICKREQSSDDLDLAKEVLRKNSNNLGELYKNTTHDLMKIKGIGPVRAARIVAAAELGRRRQSALMTFSTELQDSRKLACMIKPFLSDLRHEVFGAIYLSIRNRFIKWEIIGQGGITGVIADSKILFKNALDLRATGLVVFHNHPSGNLKPSKADEILTSKLQDAGVLLDIKLIDHIIISDSGYYSFREKGLLNQAA